MTNCVKVTTGAEYGYIFVEMVSLLDDMDTDHNEYIDLVPWQRAPAGEIIFEGCMGKKFQSITLKNNANIPWSGFIEYRETKNDTYVHMECSNCSTMAGTANHLIMVGQTIDNPINGSTICEYGCSFKIPLGKLVKKYMYNVLLNNNPPLFNFR